jgi:hypothetical protein
LSGRVPCATNILAITRQGRRVAQAALELCVSLERRDFVTFISSMSLNAELVACRTSTPWKSRQHKRRFGRSRDCDCFKRGRPRAYIRPRLVHYEQLAAFHRRGPSDHSPSTRRRYSSRISSAMLVRESRTSSLMGAHKEPMRGHASVNRTPFPYPHFW